MGVSSLVAVLAVGDGLEKFGRSMIEGEGMQLLVVESRTTTELDGVTVNRDRYPNFSSSDAAELQGMLPGGATVGMRLEGPSTVASPRDDRRRGVYLAGTLPSPGLSGSVPMAAGRHFTSDEARAGASMIVLSHDLAASLAAPAPAASMLGATVTVGERAMSVVGIQAPVEGRRESFLTALVPVDLADSLMLPSARPRVPLLVIHAPSIESMESVKAAATRWASMRWPQWKDEVRISAARAERIEQLQNGVLIFKLAMGAFTSISLVVGGVGIMNVLLASVNERTREIGIRKTVGARRRDILTQFLAESVVVTGVGSVIGAALGFAGAFGVTWLMRSQTRMEVYAAFNWQTLAVATLAALVVGLVFGTYPARRAARLAPIDAIRHD